MGLIKDVVITPLKIIEAEGGSVYHVIRSFEKTYKGFGEAYFSTIHYNIIKPWKRHNKMTLNIAVIDGAIRFVIYDDRDGSDSYGEFQEIILGPQVNYARLTVPPGLWMAFQGAGSKGTNLLINIADMPHDATEVDRLELIDLPYIKWTF